MPDELADWLEDQASRQHRSVSGQVVHHTTIMMRREAASAELAEAEQANSQEELRRAHQGQAAKQSPFK